MKKKWTAMLLALCMVAGMLPVGALADEPVYVAWIGEQGYETLEDAVTAAESGATITLGEGKYTLYGKGAETTGKDLTFVGQGADKTAWGIGATIPDPDKFGTEYNGDYSFDGAGTITFRNMTLQSGSADYLGFIRADHTVVEDCTINGKTFYWGYSTAAFQNTTFNAPEGDYAIWTYCSPVMTFDGCTFNISGKAINVYRESGEFDVTVNYKDCSVVSTKDGKAVMNINDSLMGESKFTINISGTNTVEGLTSDNANEEYTKDQKDVTCSKLFEFNTKYGAGNSGRTIVKIDGVTVWENGKMVSHAVDTENDKYTDGYKDNAFDITYDWTKQGTRTVTKTCRYCGYTETSLETRPVDWDVSKSKTATNLDSNYESEVTLSLPSAEEQLVSDVVFVLDKSTSTNVVQEAQAMLESLKSAVAESGAKVKVGVVIFNKEDHRVLELTELNDANIDRIKSEIGNEGKINGGTNAHAGLQAGKAMLDEDNSVSADRKYLIFVSDGITYIFDDEEGTATSIVTEQYFYEASVVKSTPSLTMTGAAMKYPYGQNFFEGTTVSAYLEGIGDLMQEDQDVYWVPYDSGVGEATKTLKSNVNEAGVKTLDDETFAQYVGNDGVNAHANNLDTALYLTDQVYQEAVNAGYHCYAVSKNNSTNRDYPWADTFMDYLAGGEKVSFDNIQNDILYLLGPGSTIVDEIGNTADHNFDLVIPEEGCPFTLTVGETEYTAAQVGNNEWTFTNPSATAAEFRIVYENEGTEKFTWYINTNVSNFAPVKLTYKVKLTDPKIASGTYGTYDKDGSKGYNGLHTNNSAVLYPVDSEGNDNYVPEEFSKPTVSYMVSGGNSGGTGGGGGTSPVLNTDDHFSYIIGYVDGTVQPTGAITRGEVATIFFRLLTDGARDKYWSQESGYSDCNSTQWYNNAISTLTNLGVINGRGDGTFRPDDPITRAEFAKIAVSFFETTKEEYQGYFPDVPEEAWYAEYVEAAARIGLIQGTDEGVFRPEDDITRAEACAIVNRTLGRKPNEDHLLPGKDMVTWPDNLPGTWYYAEMQEATNSHDYTWLTVKGEEKAMEDWTAKLPQRDWAAFERAWSTAHSAPGGEVVK